MAKINNWSQLLVRCQHISPNLKTCSPNPVSYITVQFILVTQSCLTLCNPMDCSTPGFPVHHQLPELTQTHAHWVCDTMQPVSYLYYRLAWSEEAMTISRWVVNYVPRELEAPEGSSSVQEEAVNLFQKGTVTELRVGLEDPLPSSSMQLLAEGFRALYVGLSIMLPVATHQDSPE